MATTVEKLVLLIEDVGVEKAERAFGKAKKKIEETGNAAQNTSEQVKKTGVAFKQFRGASSALTNTTGQLSVQVQDVAVQLESGTDAVRVFAQQGPQIAAIFGPQGALFGALLAVGALVAGPFVRSFFAANEAIKEAAKSIKEYSGELSDLTEAEKALKLNQIVKELKDLEDQTKDLEEAQADAQERFDDLRSSGGNLLVALGEITSGFTNLRDAQADSSEQLAETTVALEKAEKRKAELIKQSDILTGRTKEETKEFKKQKENIESLVAAITEEVAVLGLSNAQRKVREVAMAGGDQALQNAIKTQMEYIESFLEQEKAQEKAIQVGESLFNSLQKQAQKLTETRAETLRNELATAQLSDENRLLAESYIDLIEQEDDRIKKLKEQKKELNDFIAKGAEFRKAVEEEQKAIEDREKAAKDAAKKRLKAENEALDDIARSIAEEDAYYQEQSDRQAERAQNNIDYRNQLRADELAAEKKAAEERARIASDYTDGLLMLEDKLMKGKTEKQKLGFRTLVNLSNLERRENAKKIISDSYAAAMAAQKALAGIPIVGPVLAAAAAGTIIAGGVTYAANSLAGRAVGGQVREGESYIVGERGPEVLTMGSNGRVIPNEKIGSPNEQSGNRVANVTFNINATDASGFDRLLTQRRGMIVTMINQALSERGKPAIV